MTTLAITGAAGRMGRRLIALAAADKELEVLAAIEQPESTEQSRDAGDVAGVGSIGVPISFDLRPTPNVLIDFTVPPATRHWLKTCRDRGIAMVIGTTGLEPHDHAAIDRAAADIAILQAANMSVGVNVLLKLVADAAKNFGDADIEIIEAHHRFKKDAPSGTALALGKATGRDVPMHSQRIGDEVGKHTVYFASLGERLELTHVATNRDTFAHGALRAAKWIASQKPGRYSMADVLKNS